MTETRLSFEDGTQFAWDQTSIKAAQRCLRYYKLSILDGWHTRGRSEHLFFGGIYASCLEHFHKYLADGLEFDAAQLAIVQEAMIETWDHERDSTGVRMEGTGQPWESTDSNKTRETLIRALIWYTEEFRVDPFETVILANGKPAVELTFALPLTDKLLLTGHLDRVGRMEDSVFVIDNKTTKSAITPYYKNQYLMDNQVSAYSFAGTAVLGSPIRGMIIDAAQILVNSARFFRFPVYRTPEQLEEWLEVTLGVIDRAQTATREQEFTPNFTACNDYLGCEFRDICSAPKSVRGQFLRGNFEKRKELWDPLKSR